MKTLLLAIFLFAVGLTCWSAEDKDLKITPLPKTVDSMGYPTDPAAAYAQGQTDARRDLTNGVFSVKTFGLPSPDRSEYERLLKARCNVQLDAVAGCMVTESLDKYVDGYDEVSIAYLQQKFGTNILDELDKEAKANYEKSVQTISGPGDYKVCAGDTLIKIARQNGVTLKALQDANPKLDPTRLQVGQKIIIPGKDTSKQSQAPN